MGVVGVVPFLTSRTLLPEEGGVVSDDLFMPHLCWEGEGEREGGVSDSFRT